MLQSAHLVILQALHHVLFQGPSYLAASTREIHHEGLAPELDAIL